MLEQVLRGKNWQWHSPPLHFEQRRWRHFGDAPEGSDFEYIQAVVRAIRESVRRYE